MTHGGWLGLPFFTQFARDLALPQYTEAPAAAVPAIVGDGVHEVPALPVRVVRCGPWTVTLSGFTRPEQPKHRWELDYQAHVSIFHEHCGLIVGGGGGKRQAALSLVLAAAAARWDFPALRSTARWKRLARRLFD